MYVEVRPIYLHLTQERYRGLEGTIAVGSDADITLWDEAETKTVRAAEMYSRAGYSVYEGMDVTGWPRMTIRRGEVVYERGKILGRAGSGQWIRRGATQRLPAVSGNGADAAG